ncbi:hypothetical protein OGATHE_001747 [Ogataea polymorpha]|uniref:Uncharacterized protein n=1 Tax=Ogataea polymorpha TaxID=460523 RepID=A0A9P8PNK1_9ASCO|nr:hypothetical protein OGATHE_001747 [Ogataea polymorpha]
MKFPVSPLDSLQVFLDVKQKPFSFRLLADRVEQELYLVHTIDWSIIRHFMSTNANNCGEKVCHMYNFVSADVFWNISRPPENAWNSKTALHCRVERVFTQTRIVNKFDQLANTVIHLHHRVGKVAVIGDTSKVLVGQSREMQVNKRVVEEERLFLVFHSSHKINTFVDKLLVNHSSLLQIVNTNLFGLLASSSLHDVWRSAHAWIKPNRACELRFIGRSWYSIPLVKSTIGWISTWHITQVPLPVMGRFVASLSEDFWQSLFPALEPLWESSWHRLSATGSDRVSSRHQGRPGRHTVTFHIKIRTQETLRRQMINIWGWSTSQHSSSVASKLTKSKVVRKNKHDVRSFWVFGHVEIRIDDVYDFPVPSIRIN